MDKIVNPQTDQILVNRLSLIGGHVQVDIVRSLFDTKMAGLLDGAGGASCHLCTASDEEIKSIDWIRSGFPINSNMEELCKETYEYILVQFPWANITSSLHKLLSHSFKIIGDYNNGRGLQNLSEECLEACNMFLRRYRENLARKHHSLTMYEIF
ncbi:hypothetical protein LOD99_9104 [Oopsacas minuta]|uniref:Uncharacterized protein n=1 Tax=Oopsacas minuta TaxID=111878 RepID=A0AAV7JDQ6_9METZ|nr:hypothetical protein LOD99_9104 [Oopsacas minuta]